MNPTARSVLSFCILALAASAPAAWSARADEAAKPIVFCAEAAAMPRTGKEPDGAIVGLDVAVARLVCEKLGRPFEVHWCASAACSRRCLSEKRCDIILGHAMDEGAPREIAWSVPYARSGFGLVVPRDVKDVRSLADLVGGRIGIVAGSVMLAEGEHTVVRYKTREEVLSHFVADELDAAFMDADFAAWRLHQQGDSSLRLVEGYTPREHWNMAFAARSSDASLMVQVNRALAELSESGEMASAFAELGVPYQSPFASAARSAAPVDTWSRIAERGAIALALDPANLPYSSADEERPGVDLELAREIARNLNLELRVEWLDILRETAIGKLLEGECDFALGAAIEPGAVDDEQELAGRVLYSSPYYGTGYLLVNRKGGPKASSLAELTGQRSRRLGTEAGSVADYALRQRGYLRSLFRNQLAVLKSLDDGHIDHGYVWSNVGWTLAMTPEFELEIAPSYVPEDHWNIAVILRAGDGELKRRIDTAIEKLVADGTVARTLERYHIPYFPPFADAVGGEPASGVGSRGGIEASRVIHHAAIDRGLEPQTQAIHTSRSPYSGLARVRSAGTLVVALDQRNLPFASVHPRPAGIDYEIARLLAERLGLSLRVYWADSAHDGYPSKLATKKFCDLVLGVMQDDRFADRVLYSKPYYMTSYQMVVRAADSRIETFGDLGASPLAVEPGVAVRSITNLTTRAYPSPTAILDAVAARQVDAGYVISTLGHWLAESRMHGQLRFVQGDPADRFAIRAAVRKADVDLRDAIDQALEELARSGEIAAVLARWHIPYAAPSDADLQEASRVVSPESP